MLVNIMKQDSCRLAEDSRCFRHPLAEALSRPVEGQEEHAPLPSLALGGDAAAGVGHGERWYRGCGLTKADSPTLRELIHRHGRFCGTDRPFLPAALLMMQYVHTFIEAGLRGLFVSRRVPDLDAGNCAIKLDAEGDIAGYRLRSMRFAALAGDPASRHPDAAVLADRDALVRWMFDRMAQCHFTPLFEEVRKAAGLSSQVLWGNVACSCASLVNTLRAPHLTPDETLEEIDRLFAQHAPLQRKVSVYPLEYRGVRRLFMRRRTCCQKHLHPDMGKCGYCSLRPEAEQLALQRSLLQRSVDRV